MYNIGDKIVYPMHGAGIIEAIEEMDFRGSRCGFYVLRMPVGGMCVKIPACSGTEVGLRRIIDPAEADKVFDMFKNDCEAENTNWSKRYRENMVRIKSGNIYEVAGVVKSLMLREKEKGLSTGEKRMLSSARQILVSELVLAKSSNQLEIERKINLSIGV
ncbi:MAG TPA: CarD family transcriptional regulator [Clostridiales bacterium]|nr:CarD family transcriptional regulator [Clostridiales bacterium]